MPQEFTQTKEIHQVFSFCEHTQALNKPTESVKSSRSDRENPSHLEDYKTTYLEEAQTTYAA